MRAAQTSNWSGGSDRRNRWSKSSGSSAHCQTTVPLRHRQQPRHLLIDRQFNLAPFLVGDHRHRIHLECGQFVDATPAQTPAVATPHYAVCRWRCAICDSRRTALEGLRDRSMRRRGSGSAGGDRWRYWSGQVVTVTEFRRQPSAASRAASACRGERTAGELDGGNTTTIRPGGNSVARTGGGNCGGCLQSTCRARQCVTASPGTPAVQRPLRPELGSAADAAASDRRVTDGDQPHSAQTGAAYRSARPRTLFSQRRQLRRAWGGPGLRVPAVYNSRSRWARQTAVIAAADAVAMYAEDLRYRSPDPAGRIQPVAAVRKTVGRHSGSTGCRHSGGGSGVV